MGLGWKRRLRAAGVAVAEDRPDGELEVKARSVANGSPKPDRACWRSLRYLVLSKNPIRRAQTPPHRVERNADLPSNRLLADAATRQRPNRGHQLTFDQRYLPRRRYHCVPLELH